MKYLAAMGTVRELNADDYVSNPFSHAMTRSIFRESVNLMYVA